VGSLPPPALSRAAEAQNVWLAPIAAVEYLEAALSFTSNDGLGVPIAQLDLTNRPASGVNLPENYRRAVPGASRRSARRRVAASPDLNGCRERIEVGLEDAFRLLSSQRSRCPTYAPRIAE
jgi:hypothetical protein